MAQRDKLYQALAAKATTQPLIFIHKSEFLISKLDQTEALRTTKITKINFLLI